MAYKKIAQLTSEERKTHEKNLRSLRRCGESLDDLLEEQGRKCAICGCTNTTRWCVDHDRNCCLLASSHKPTCGTCNRGVLCLNCNIGLGKFKDNIEALTNAIEYLKFWNQIMEGKEPKRIDAF